MRPILIALFAFAPFANEVSPVAAQTWPTRPVTMGCSHVAPGGGTDLLGRIVAKRLAEVLGQQVVVENAAGAGGMLGSARVVKSAPDGYTMVIGTTADAINQTLYKAPLYNTCCPVRLVVLLERGFVEVWLMASAVVPMTIV